MEHASPQALPGEFKRMFPGRRFVFEGEDMK
jgi:hypothetical protein